MIRLPTLFFILLATAHAADDAAKKPAGAPDAKTAPAAAEEKKEWVLFDGKSLDDWEMVDIGASGAVEIHHQISRRFFLDRPLRGDDDAPARREKRPR